jgi:hypothetical protein
MFKMDVKQKSQAKICPFMETPTYFVPCVREKCMAWYQYPEQIRGG